MNFNDLTVKIVTKSCGDVDWDAYQRELSKVEMFGAKKVIVEMEKEGVSEKGLPTKMTVTLTGRNPEKVLRRAKHWCKRIS